MLHPHRGLAPLGGSSALRRRLAAAGGSVGRLVDRAETALVGSTRTATAPAADRCARCATAARDATGLCDRCWSVLEPPQLARAKAVEIAFAAMAIDDPALGESVMAYPYLRHQSDGSILRLDRAAERALDRALREAAPGTSVSLDSVHAEPSVPQVLWCRCTTSVPDEDGHPDVVHAVMRFRVSRGRIREVWAYAPMRLPH